RWGRASFLMALTIPVALGGHARKRPLPCAMPSQRGFRACRAGHEGPREVDARKGAGAMVAAILLLLLIAILFGVGAAAVHALIWIAVALLVLWVIGWVIGAGAGAGAAGTRRRWYYW